jgi:undecaprenyl pyrophosphate phosphatase UppP
MASRVMSLALTPEQLTSSIAVIQLGTLIAVLIYFAGDIWNISIAFVRDHLALITGGKDPQRLIACGLDGLAGGDRFASGRRRRLAVQETIEGTFTKNLWVIATMMVVIAVLAGCR